MMKAVIGSSWLVAQDSTTEGSCRPSKDWRGGGIRVEEPDDEPICILVLAIVGADRCDTLDDIGVASW
jgi:hypothetical protein